MKKAILPFMVCLLALLNLSVHGQIMESAEFSAKKGCSFFPIGESGEFIYYCNLLTPSNDKIKVTIEKFRTSTLEFIESKEISPRDFVPQEYVYNKLICDVHVALKNHKFYIFYSLVNKGEYALFAKVVDENFTNEQNIEIGSFKEKAKGSADMFQMAFSNDDSKALFVLKKSYFRATKAIGGPMESYYHTEFYGYDMISNKVLFSKILPGELKDLTLKSDNYLIDNKGNVFFLAKLSEKKDNVNVLRELSIGLLETNKQDCSFKSIDLTGFRYFGGRLKYLKNDNILFVACSNGKSKLVYISLSDPSLNFEKTADFTKNCRVKFLLELKDIISLNDNVYLTFVENDAKGVLFPRRIFISNVSATGNILWEQDISSKTYSSYKGYAMLKTPTSKTDKINVLYEENIKDENARNKKYETMLSTIDNEGHVKTQTVNADEKIQIYGRQSITTAKNEVIFLVKRYSEKKMILKKVPFN